MNPKTLQYIMGHSDIAGEYLAYGIVFSRKRGGSIVFYNTG